MSLIFVFIDGIGLVRDHSDNPFTSDYYESFDRMTGGQPFTSDTEAIQNGNAFFSAIDACLGVDGLPQSGTGQVTLFSGINTARMIGKHFGPYPHSKIRQYLGEDSIFRKFQKEKGRTCFVNAFPEVFFEYAQKRNRWSSTTLMTRKAGLRLNSVQEVLEGKAITAEITQRVWRERLSLDVPIITEADAADRLVSTASEHDLVLMEYYLTDKAGHEQDMDGAREILIRLDRFLIRLFDEAAENGHTVMLTSDHGNLEDLSVKTHTRNKVPFYVLGDGLHHFHNIRSIQDVTPLSLEWYRSTLFG